MFEIAEVGNRVDKPTFKRREPEVHETLLGLQRRLRSTGRPLVIIVSGVEGAGKGEVVDRLNRWFDTRDVITHAFFDETDEERDRPDFWRFWRTLPARGETSIMFGSWYTRPIVDHVLAKTDADSFAEQMRQISALEKMLCEDGTLIVKLWYHLTQKQQHKRLNDDVDVAHFKRSPLLEDYASAYPQFLATSERAIRLTDTELAPWHIIEAGDHRYRDLTTADILIERLTRQLESPGPKSSTSTNNVAATPDEKADLVAVTAKTENTGFHPGDLAILDSIDLTQQLAGKAYRKKLRHAQEELHALAWKMHHSGRNLVLVFEGWDAAGKGSAIRRATAAIDARLYRVIPVAAPTDEERSHHYLWRFWRHIPRAGRMTIYDRSWYGRVLVERVEALASSAEWRRAYHEINEFEDQLHRHGAVIIKFWLHISAEEQLARFHARELDPRKKHKITEEDWRNRDRWQDYSQAVNDMVAHTSNTNAPWVIVPANDKKFARVQVLETINEHLRDRLDP